MENNNTTAEQLGKIIGAAALEVVSETMEGDTQDNTTNDDTIHGRGESGLGGETEDGTPLRKDGQPDGRSTSPNRGGRGRVND